MMASRRAIATAWVRFAAPSLRNAARAWACHNFSWVNSLFIPALLALMTDPQKPEAPTAMKIVVATLTAFLLSSALASTQVEARCWWNGYDHCRYHHYGWYHHGYYHHGYWYR